MQMIDIWLIFAQTVPFVQVLLFTIRDTIEDDEREKQPNGHFSTTYGWQKIKYITVGKDF